MMCALSIYIHNWDCNQHTHHILKLQVDGIDLSFFFSYHSQKIHFNIKESEILRITGTNENCNDLNIRSCKQLGMSAPLKFYFV